ncbi:MAG: sel1 repeat family protein [Sphingobacteriia bacterium]|nr:sel1 repeat family protein [Sphingobacteriia bacterium]NCC39884.1 sel1 repeat family protein [Gammaproteobacteria bacterium]
MSSRSSSSRMTLVLSAALVLLGTGCASDGPVDQSTLHARAAGPADAPGAVATVIGQIEDLTVVDCLLPGRLRKMGRTLTWVGRPRATKQTISDCEILGGQYVLFDRADYSTALAVWQVAAEQGDPTAQSMVGEILERGLGRAPDHATAAQWYRKAAEQGFARAQFSLGALYEKGLGVPRDPVAALDWYRRAAGLQQDKVVFLSQALAEAKPRQPRSTPRASAPTGSAPTRPEPARQPQPDQGAPALTQSAQAELRRLATVAATSQQALVRAENARDRAKEEIVLRSRETRLLDQTAPVIRADRRLIDQYVALTQQAETQRIAAESLERVLDVAAPVMAQQ